MRRRLGLVLLSIAALLLLVHTAAWLIVTSRIRDAIPAFTAAAMANGWQVEAGQAGRAGWPWAATVRLTDVQAERLVGSPASAVPLRWRLPRLDVTLSPADPAALHLVPYGQQSVALGDGAPLPVEVGRGLLRIPFGAEPAMLAVSELAAGPLRVEWIEARFAADTVAGQARGIRPVPAAAAPFDTPGVLGFHVLVEPAWPFAATPRGAAAAWRLAGGTLSAPELRGTWGPLEIVGSLTGGLDAALQPTGTGQFRVAGALPALEAAGRAGLLRSGAVNAARTVVMVLTLGASGQPVTLPMTLVDQTLTAAGFPLLRLPPLLWN